MVSSPLTLPFPTKGICDDAEHHPGGPDGRPHPDPSPSHTCRALLATNGHTRAQRSGHRHPRWPTVTVPTLAEAPSRKPCAPGHCPPGCREALGGEGVAGPRQARTQVCRSCCPRLPGSPHLQLPPPGRAQKVLNSLPALPPEAEGVDRTQAASLPPRGVAVGPVAHGR